jgi:hypothetical protein
MDTEARCKERRSVVCVRRLATRIRRLSGPIGGPMYGYNASS